MDEYPQKTVSEMNAAFRALESSVNGVIMANPEGLITYANPAFLSMFHFEQPSEAIGVRVEDLFISDNVREVSDVIDDERSRRQRTREFRVTRADRTDFTVEVAGEDIVEQDGSVLGSMVFFVDISRRKAREEENLQYQRRLRLLANRLARLEEVERRRVAGLLHDTVIQSLSLSNMKLGPLFRAFVDADLGEEAEQLKSVRELLAEAIRQCRLVMSDLIPSTLHAVGLGSALQELATQLGEQHGVAIYFDEDGPAHELPDQYLGLLYQASRELIINALKHAAPSEVSVQLKKEGELVNIRVEDDGSGFVPAMTGVGHWGASSGFGLFSIQQRLEDLGGRLDIESERGRGTRISLVLSCPATGTPS